MAASPSLSSATFPVDQAPTLSLAGETSPDESDTDPGDPPDEPDEFVGGYPEQRLPTPDQGPQPGVGRALVGLTPGQRSDSGRAGGAVALVGAPATRRDHGHELWWRDHADPHMRALMDSTGPFSRETEVKATVQEPLPYEPPPEGLFPDVREEKRHP